MGPSGLSIDCCSVFQAAVGQASWVVLSVGSKRLLHVLLLPQVVWTAVLSCHNAGPLFMFYLTTASLYGLAVLWMLFIIVNTLSW